LFTAYTPQQNGICERNNRTILNMVRSLLPSNGVPKAFWPEAINWSIHILNRSLTVVVQNMTQQEAWSNQRQAIDYFRIFGCVAYAYIPYQRRRKLNDKGEKCIFLGISEQSKAYKLYNPITKKMVISRDVLLDEGMFWNWDTSKVKHQIQADFNYEDEEAQQPQITQVQSEQQVELVDEREQQAVESKNERSQRNKRRPA